MDTITWLGSARWVAVQENNKTQEVIMVSKHLDGLLSPLNRAAGFSVIEMDDDAVCLIRNFQTVATFNQQTTAGDINDEADRLREI